TGPLSDKLAGSISASYRHGDGFVKGIGPNVGRRYGNPENQLFRGKLLFKPTDTFQATLAGDAWKIRDNSIFTSAPRTGANSFPGPGSVVATPLHYAGSSQPIAKVKGKSISLDASWEPTSDTTLRSITGYRKAEGTYQTDQDRTNQSRGGLALAQNQE